jgi:hypothetical protein
MPRKSPIVKVLAWRNPGPLGREPRWDLEVVREDGTRERVVGLDGKLVKELVDLAGKAGKKGRRRRA